MDLSVLGFTSALDLAASIRRKELSPVEVIDGVLARIAQLDPALNAFSQVLAADARAAAQRAEAAVQRGDDLGPLHGVPVGVKDQMNVTGAKVTFGTHLLADYVATEDAPVVANLRKAGAVVVGMTTMPEFGWNGISWSPLYGMTRNPWNLERSASGSSSGSGAAVAAGIVPLAVGSDGAGSIRMPASFCGIVGLKPTYGRVAMFPVSVSELVTHYGPMTRTVRDNAAMLSAIAGPDLRDPHCLPASNEDYLASCEGGVRGLRIAFSPDLGYAKVNPEVAAVVAASVTRFEELGATVVQANPGFSDPIWAADQYLWAGAANRAYDRLDEMRDKMDPGFVQAVELLSTRTLFDGSKARLVRLDLAATMGRFFGQYDLLVTPTMADLPFGLDRSAPEYGPSLGWTPFTYPFNLTGEPAITVPAGLSADGLPIGMQIVGPRFSEGRVLRAAAAFEAAQPWADRRPPTS
ncbi:MAG: amidase [Chloroflexi bacterium]|nr:amidase [Chloroflexota bacterium]